MVITTLKVSGSFEYVGFYFYLLKFGCGYIVISNTAFVPLSLWMVCTGVTHLLGGPVVACAGVDTSA